MILLPPAIVADMTEHARAEAPVEACGLLAGTGEAIAKSYRLTNVDGSPEHFSLDPKEQFAVLHDARANGLQVLGVYHSHPATPARMSAEDLRLAFDPEFHYVIVSLAGGGEPVVRSFRVVGGGAVEEPVLPEEIR